MDRLDATATVLDAFAMVNDSRLPLLRALLLPSLALGALQAVEPSLEQAGWALSLLHLGSSEMVYAVFAVSCHRVLLLGVDSLPNRWGVYFTLRELRFFAFLVAISTCALLPIVLLALFLGVVNVVLPGDPLEFDVVFGLAILLAGPFGWYMFSRASLILPAVALGLSTGIRESWNQSRGNGLRLALALGVPVLIFGFAARGIESTVQTNSPFPSAAVSALTWLLVALEVAVVSASFKRLGGPLGNPSIA